MPWPANVSFQSGRIPITSDFSVAVSGAGAKDPRVIHAVERIWPRLARQAGQFIRPNFRSTSEGATLSIVVEQRDHKPPQRLGDDERYSLEAAGDGIRISADYPLGALRGIETFLQAVQQNTKEDLPSEIASGFSMTDLKIQDAPRFPWRGLSLDVSRHFIPVDEVERTIDGLSAVKLNVLHWHLSDDQGFRVESKKYKRLQEYGSNGQYYTQAEIREVVAYARDRGVRIVPEFDMPGHATSWLPGYPMLAARPGSFEIGASYGILSDLMDPTKESTYRFLNNFVGEMVKLFPDEYFHIGGDEVDPKQWNENPRIQVFMKKHHLADAKALQVYFNQRLLKIVTRHGKRMEGWDEVLQPDLPKSVMIQSWRGQESLWQAAREGYQGILSAGYYLDLMRPASYHYAVDPLVLPEERKAALEKEGKPIPEPPTPEEQKNILGGEAAMWEELADAENLDSRLWPRLAAIAERFWSPQSVTDVKSMYARLEPTNDWLEWLGLNQRSNLELMRQRLAGASPHVLLDRFVDTLEPVKGYARGADKYATNTPLNRLVDSIPPESNAARVFREAADRFLGAPPGQRYSAHMRTRLAEWGEDARTIRPIFENNSLLTENLPVADSMAALCQVGVEALLSLDPATQATNVRDAAWKERATAAAKEGATRKGDVLIAIAPAIAKLVDAVNVAPAQ
jgi:hexosaminidase